MVETGYVIMAILVGAAATFLTRAMPFAVLSRWVNHPMLRYLSWSLPPAIMMVLVFYSLRDTWWGVAPYGVPELICVAVVAGLHIWRRNALLSISLGTLLYVVLVQTRALG